MLKAFSVIMDDMTVVYWHKILKRKLVNYFLNLNLMISMISNSVQCPERIFHIRRHSSTQYCWILFPQYQCEDENHLFYSWIIMRIFVSCHNSYFRQLQIPYLVRYFFSPKALKNGNYVRFTYTYISIRVNNYILYSLFPCAT